jgi:molybdopterin-guanine dinucleotide biosynthesis protein A
MNLSAIILAGGESRRMGQDKAWVTVNGQPLIERAVATVRELGIEEVFVSGRPGTDYSAFPCPVLYDLEPGCGPVAGIERGLNAATNGLVLVLAVDLPRMTEAFLRRLVGWCGPLTGAVPRTGEGLEPLVAIYPRRCQEIARKQLLKLNRAARDFAEECRQEQAVKIYRVPHTEEGCFENWNWPWAVDVKT